MISFLEPVPMRFYLFIYFLLHISSSCQFQSASFHHFARLILQTIELVIEAVDH